MQLLNVVSAWRSFFACRALLSGTITALCFAWSAGAQPPAPAPGSAFRADSRLVLVPITVLDRQGNIVNGLPKDAFVLTENGVRQQIRSFALEDAPVSLGIVLDLSGSMRTALPEAKESLRKLMEDANPDDEAFLNGVSSRPRAFSGFTRNLAEIVNRVAWEGAGGDTALVDTIYDSLFQLRAGTHDRKALLVISDGMDNHSRHSKRQLMDRAVEADVQIYTIAVGRLTAGSGKKPMDLLEQKGGVLFLDELAAKTGGLSFLVGNRSDIPHAVASIGEALRRLYTIGYAPDGNARGGQWRRIKVTVEGSGLRAYARTGYRLD